MKVIQISERSKNDNEWQSPTQLWPRLTNTIVFRVFHNLHKIAKLVNVEIKWFYRVAKSYLFGLMIQKFNDQHSELTWHCLQVLDFQILYSHTLLVQEVTHEQKFKVWRSLN